jgi:dihydrofolate reductase
VTKVVIDMTMSLDGFVAGPDDGKQFPLGRHGGTAIFDWYTSGDKEIQTPLFKPEPGANREQVERMFAEAGAFVFGRKTYDITNGWGGRHPVDGAPVFVLTHKPPPPAEVPKGPSNLTFVTDGIESALGQAKAVARGKDVKLGGASPGKQVLVAGLADEIPVSGDERLTGRSTAYTLA